MKMRAIAGKLCWLGLAALGPVAASCTGPGADRPQRGTLDAAPAWLPACPTVENSFVGWTNFDGQGAFQLRVPPGYEEQPVQGIDSYVGGWRRGRSRIGFDYGWYSDPLEPPPAEELAKYDEYARCTAVIGGDTARIATTLREGLYSACGHWRRRNSASSLTLCGSGPTARDRAEALAMFQTVRLRPASR